MFCKKIIVAAILGATFLVPTEFLPVASAAKITADDYHDKGYESYIKDDYKNAIKYYRKALKIDPNHKDSLSDMEWAYKGLGSSYEDQGRYKEMAEVYEELTKINPNDSDHWRYLGEAYSELGNYNKAVDSYRKSLELLYTFHDNMGFALYDAYIMDAKYCLRELDVAYLALENYDNALECLNSVIELGAVSNFKDFWAANSIDWQYLGVTYRNVSTQVWS